MDNIMNREDHELRAIIARLENELAEREKKKKAQAITEIKRIADAAGLTANIREKGQKRRGRPTKNKDA